MTNKIRITAFLFIFTSLCFGQTKEITDAENELDQLNAKIERVNSILEDLKEKQTTEENSLKKLDLKIYKSTKKYRSVKKALDITKKKIRYAINQKKKLEKEIATLRKEFEKRVVASYKLPELNWIDILLSSSSVEEFFRLVEYNKTIHAEEKKLSEKLKKAITQREKLVAQLAKERKKNESLLAEQKTVLNELKEDEKDKKLYIAANKKDQKKYRKSLFKYVEDRKHVEKIMASLFAKLKGNKSDVSTSGLADLADYKPLSTNFKKNRGRFHWPVKGKIIRGFGKKKEAKNVSIISNGIDISAKKSSKVKSIHKGRVTLIDYVSGFGHFIVIDHGKTYFTSYSNLSDIFVRANDVVEAGEVIGAVGNSGTFDGVYKLHFEIWWNNKPLNPKKWLR